MLLVSQGINFVPERTLLSAHGTPEHYAKMEKLENWSMRHTTHEEGVGFLVHKDIGLPPNLQQAPHHPPEGSTIQHHGGPSLHPDIDLQ